MYENENHPLTLGTYDWEGAPSYGLWLNGVCVGARDCLRDACLEGQRILTEEGIPPFCAILIVNERTNVVERVLVDDANGLVHHVPDMSAR